MKSLNKNFSNDWTILRYGWLAVFIIHISYLIYGNQWLKSALAFTHESLSTPPEVRITYALTSARMIIVGFSSVILMITVFIYEIFKMVRELRFEIAELKEALLTVPASEANACVSEGEEEIVADEDPLVDEPELF